MGFASVFQGLFVFRCKRCGIERKSGSIARKLSSLCEQCRFLETCAWMGEKDASALIRFRDEKRIDAEEYVRMRDGIIMATESLLRELERRRIASLRKKWLGVKR